MKHPCLQKKTQGHYYPANLNIKDKCLILKSLT